MKQLFTIALLIFATITNAQTEAIPQKIENTDVYVLMMNTAKTTTVGSVVLTKEQIASAKSIKDLVRIGINSSNKKFDAVLTRGGQVFQLLKYDTKQKEYTGKTMKVNKKDVYIFASPVKKYSIVSSKEIEKGQSFIQIANTHSKNAEIIFDAIIIDEDVKYILYK